MTYDKYTCPVSHPGLRRDYIGSSDASAIMGESPWDTALTVWETKLGLRPCKELSYVMSEGVRKEPIARDWVKSKTNITFIPKRVFNDDYPFAMASLDGLSDCGNIALEIKCPGARDHETALNGEVPKKYYAQLQHQMLVTGHKEMYYASYTDASQKLLIVQRDDEYQEKLIQAEKEFYKKLKEFIEPTHTDKDFTCRNDFTWAETCQMYKTYDKIKKDAEHHLEQYREKLLQLCDGKSSRGAGITVAKSSRKGNINYKNIPDLKEVDLEKYRAPASESWRITIQGELQND